MVERREQVEVDPRVASALGVPEHLARRDLAARVAVFGGLHVPRRAETNRVLSEIVLGVGPLLDAPPADRDDVVFGLLSPLRPQDDDMALAVCAADLGALSLPDPVPFAPEPGWTLGQTVGVALDELLEQVTNALLDLFEDRGELSFA